MLEKAHKLLELIIRSPGLIALGLLIVGVLVLAIGLAYNSEFLKEIGKATFTGGVFSAFFKGLQASGIFKEELAKVVYFNDYLGRRKDIIEIWERVTKELHGNAFPQLDDKIANTVRKIYLPTNWQYYYEGMKRHIKIEAHVAKRMEHGIMRIRR